MSTKTFIELGLPAKTAAALSTQGIETTFPIQVDSLPDTLAFGIPMVARLASSANHKQTSQRLRGLVLATTRELATKIKNVLEPLATAINLRVTTIFGGVSQNKQVQALRDGVEIVVATPGRLEDLIRQGILKLDAIEITVLDEADHMADLGFLPGVTRILTATPKDGQRLLFSATLDNGVQKLVNKFLQNQVMHAVDEVNLPVSKMIHHSLEASDAESEKRLVFVLASGTGRRIPFMRTKHHAKKIAKPLTQAGRAKVLVATDVAGLRCAC